MDADKRPSTLYEATRLAHDVVWQITRHMAEHGITRAALAQQMKVTPGRISQILSGDENLTLRTLAAVTRALDAQAEIRIVSRDAYSDNGVAAADRTRPGAGPGRP